MAALTLIPVPCGYELLVDGVRAGIAYREPEIGLWVLALTEVSPRPDALWQSFRDVPADILDAAREEHATLAELCDALGVQIGLPVTPNLREAA